MDPKRFYITTAISYPNGPPHIGHAYEAIATDVLARFKRLDGYEVMFLTGTDEYGQKMEQTARKLGLSPGELADRNTPLFREMAQRLNCSNDDFIGTREPRHHQAVSHLWRRMAEKGDIYLGKYAGWYSVRDEAFYGDDELTESADGAKLAPTGTPVTWVEEESYFFRLSAYGDKLLAHYEAHPDFIMPHTRRNEVVNFVKSGLKDLSISRTSFDWGIPVPGDPKHVMYVWLDALSNYISAIGYPDGEKFHKFWPADVHIIGKDIVRFHAIYWPAFLMSGGVPLPKRVFGHGFLQSQGEKMSKSLGNVVSPLDLVERYGLDQVRYFFMREVPFGADGNYSHEQLVNRTNADLANDLGNLAQRSLSMIAKNCGGAVPKPGDFTQADRDIMDGADAMLDRARAHMETQAIHLALGEVWKIVADANRYFADQQPWALAKNDVPRMQTVLYVTVEVLRQICILAQPVIPQAAAALLDQLAIAAGARDFAAYGAGRRLSAGTALPAPAGVFPRYIEPAETAAPGKKGK
ncbi:MAG: methionyl-tRNA synthetase [Alphaproteobacteria bacterium]|nr:methionyl-tRNA synthetase [Alphaproteobacteria bacterium]